MEGAREAEDEEVSEEGVEGAQELEEEGEHDAPNLTPLSRRLGVDAVGSSTPGTPPPKIRFRLRPI